VETKVSVGILGCGNISGQYFKGCRAFSILNVVACTDLDISRAKAKAEEYNIAKVYPVKDMLADPDIQIVINLTTPDQHAAVSRQIIQAGKSVYVEKPLAITREDGQQVLDEAKQHGVLVGCAPDTFLGGGIQTSRKLIDDGWIGTPVAATAFMLSHGPESWHPNPDFYYQPGGGPLFDMGPYYLTALVNLLGGVRRVAASARKSFVERVATSPMHYGRRIPVQVNTHHAAVLEFASGAVGTLITSFDVWGHTLPRIEIYGSEGSLSVPDPNTFGGTVQVQRAGEKGWTAIPLTHSAEVGRGIGVADMAYALACGRQHRASGDLAYHVLDVMHAVEDSSRSGRHVKIKSRVKQPAALPLGLLAGTLDT
jgi:predicted dehydrogenase